MLICHSTLIDYVAHFLYDLMHLTRDRLETTSDVFADLLYVLNMVHSTLFVALLFSIYMPVRIIVKAQSAPKFHIFAL